MSKYLTPRTLALGAGALGLLYLSPDVLERMMKTPGVRNIEDRYTAGGATPNYTPAVATRRGDAEHAMPNQANSSGVPTPRYQESIGAQKPPPSTFDKAWNKAHYGAERGK